MIFRTIFLLFLLILTSCLQQLSKIEVENLNEIGLFSKKMIYNQEQSNFIEGNYLEVLEVDSNNILIDLPDNFLINSSNYKSWNVGWGNDSAFHDVGCENIRVIEQINLEKKSVKLGQLKRGGGYPKKGKNVVFWNFEQENFIKTSNKSIIDVAKWSEFAGVSLAFSDVLFNRQTNKFHLVFQECDTSKRQAYVAVSDDLIHWKPFKNGSPFIRYTAFKNISWAMGSYRLKQVPFINDVLFHNNKWYYLFSGIDANGVNTLGFGVSKSLNGKVTILEKQILPNGVLDSWNEKGNFSGEITNKNGLFLLAFDGIDKFNKESVGLAYSIDLKNWTLYQNNPVIDIHTGWRSKLESSEPNYISWKDSTIELIVSGVKKFRFDPNDKGTDSKNFKYETGNVDDAQLGVFISTDFGKTFKQHPNNPLFLNNYTDNSENEHMGGNTKFLKWKGKIYYFYQAKTSQDQLKYSIYCKVKNI